MLNCTCAFLIFFLMTGSIVWFALIIYDLGSNCHRKSQLICIILNAKISLYIRIKYILSALIKALEKFS